MGEIAYSPACTTAAYHRYAKIKITALDQSGFNYYKMILPGKLVLSTSLHGHFDRYLNLNLRLGHANHLILSLIISCTGLSAGVSQLGAMPAAYHENKMIRGRPGVSNIYYHNIPKIAKKNRRAHLLDDPFPLFVFSEPCSNDRVRRLSSACPSAFYPFIPKQDAR